MFESLKAVLEKEDYFVEKFDKDIDLTQEEIELLKGAYSDCMIIQQAIAEELPRNIYGRKYRKTEDGKYIRDEAGDYISARGPAASVLYQKIGEKITYKGNKFVGPFGG